MLTLSLILFSRPWLLASLAQSMALALSMPSSNRPGRSRRNCSLAISEMLRRGWALGGV